MDDERTHSQLGGDTDLRVEPCPYHRHEVSDGAPRRGRQQVPATHHTLLLRQEIILIFF